MKEQHQSGSVTSFYRFYRALVVPGLLFFVVTGYYAVVTPVPTNANFNLSSEGRLFGLFVIGPLTIFLGLLVMRRVPRNVIGPILVWWGCIVNAQLSAAHMPVSVQSFQLLFLATIGLPGLMLVLTHFPSGQVYPPRWQKPAEIGVVLLMLFSLSFVLLAETVYGTAVPNPFNIQALMPFSGAVLSLSSALFVTGLVLSAVVLLRRYRLTTATERKQIRWLLLWILPTLGLMLLSSLPLLSVPYWNKIVIVIPPLLFASPGIGIALAILRSHLWDIDIIIRRTLIYSILSAILALVFFGCVTLAQQLFRDATGQSSDLAIVISTLVIAVLFTPLRRRVQNIIDRRFYRRKYDAEKMLAGFSQTLRDETDLEALKASMIGVVQTTMQPTHTALWINTKEGKA